MRSNYIKTFEVTEFSTERLWYRIEVRFRGQIVDVFERRTMKEAIDDLRSAGYTRAA